MFDPISVHYIRSGNTKGKIESVGENSHARVNTDIAQFTCKGRQFAVLQSWKAVSE
jgi:hypothetical protein